MYCNLLTKQQFKCAARLLQKRQFIRVTATSNVNCPTQVESHLDIFNNPINTQKLLNPPSASRRNFHINQKYSALINPSASGEKPVRNTDITDAPSTVEHEILEDVDTEMTNFSRKTLLYEENLDNIISELNRCNNVEELNDAISRFESKMERQHRVQCIMMLWTFYCNTQDNFKRNELIKDEVIQRATTGLRPHIPSMDMNELSCCYLYLFRMGIPNTEPVMQEILLQAVHTIKMTTPPGEATIETSAIGSNSSSNSSAAISLPVLSRFLVAINASRDFHVPSVCSDFLQHIEWHIRNCSTDPDARLLAICLLNLQHLIDSELLLAFKIRIEQLLQAGILNSQTIKANIKLLNLFNLPAWSQSNSGLIRYLLLTMRESISYLKENDLKNICRIFQYHLEPAELVEPLMKSTERLLVENQPTPDVLACFMPFAEPQRRELLVNLFKELLYNQKTWQLPNATGHMFSILRGLKISDSRICDAYWSNVVNELDSCPEEATQLRFLRHCHRYINFNNNLGGTYRFIPLERKLSQLALHTIENDIAGRIPSKFARLASFVLAYGHTPFAFRKFPNVILSKMIAMSSQFSIVDCFLISRGLQVAMELRFRHNTPTLLGMQLATFDNILVTCAERHLSSNETISISDLNLIVRSLGNRKSLRNTVIYTKALNRYADLNFAKLNSRNIREMAFNFNATNFIVPKALEAMFSYIEENHQHIMGDTVEKVLTCAYNLGYTPKSQEVLEHAATILMRDFEYMSGLAIVQACLALCFYKTIPEELINRVFCVKFIQRIEDEIQTCYSRATYPERVLNLVMQLNRTVCLDYPEANVPWFQQNYLEAQLSKKPTVQGPFSDDVQKLLQSLLTDKSYFRCNHTTPYGYQIDFVIHFDRNKKPIPAPTPPPVETTMLDRITKVAILLLKLDSFCENDLTALRGVEYLKMKHLEMMGYKVLHINEHDWNSKYMNVPDAKANYLKCLLQITN